MVAGQRHEALTRCAVSSANPRQDRTLASNLEEPHLAGELLSAGRSRSPDRGLRRSLQPPALPREPEQRHARRRLFRTRQSHSIPTKKDQTKDARNATLASQTTRRIMKPTR